MKKSITIIDTFGFLFRSYFALPPLRSNNGFPTGLLTGFMNFVAGIGKDFKTDYIVLLLMQKGQLLEMSYLITTKLKDQMFLKIY